MNTQDSYVRQIEVFLPESMTDEEHSKVMDIVNEMQDKLQEMEDRNEDVKGELRRILCIVEDLL